ncbi:hypothetical protein KQX54_018891 [Cotesia glomerata]|uniref:Uncharacterized protein n=1 Tax=Cotesia glomerata TaxID=32391 RepID=A0AAV7HYR2_COTGL|nr:hypothetical protein KQX54_018891 [Cotesia glomerata]
MIRIPVLRLFQSNYFVLICLKHIYKLQQHQFKDHAVTKFAEGTVRSRKDVTEQQADDDGRTRRKKRKTATIIELRRTKKNIHPYDIDFLKNIPLIDREKLID